MSKLATETAGFTKIGSRDHCWPGLFCSFWWCDCQKWSVNISSRNLRCEYFLPPYESYVQSNSYLLVSCRNSYFSGFRWARAQNASADNWFSSTFTMSFIEGQRSAGKDREQSFNLIYQTPSGIGIQLRRALLYEASKKWSHICDLTWNPVKSLSQTNPNGALFLSQSPIQSELGFKLGVGPSKLKLWL